LLSVYEAGSGKVSNLPAVHRFAEEVRASVKREYHPFVDESDKKVVSYNLTDEFHDDYLSPLIARALIDVLELETEESDDIIVKTTMGRGGFFITFITDLLSLFEENNISNSETVDFIRYDLGDVIFREIYETGPFFSIYEH